MAEPIILPRAEHTISRRDIDPAALKVLYRLHEHNYVAYLVGGNSLWANFFASLAGALMYFATLTEIPVVQGLLGSGMGRGPALALRRRARQRLG